MKRLVRKIMNLLDFDIVKLQEVSHPDIKEEEFWEIYNLCKPFTMTSVERMYSLYKSVKYILLNNIEGAFVECGVWRGGCVMLIAKMLSNRNIKDREIYLYDTFEGMSEASEFDISHKKETAKSQMKKIGYNEKGSSNWCYADLNDVKRNMRLTNYEISEITFVKGKVEDTIPLKSPDGNIALLRLDTDWYESTKHELKHLFPKLSNQGILIIDDYGHWEGCRKAVDEYFVSIPILLNRIDYTGRIGIKTISKSA